MLIKIDQIYIMYKEERNIFKRDTIVKSRKLVDLSANDLNHQRGVG